LRFNRRLAAAAALILLATTEALPAGTAVQAERPPPYQRLTAALAHQLSAKNVGAAALVIVEDGQAVVLRGFGSATPETPFRLGSITKTFTALALLRAADEHSTPLSTPVRSILGDGLWNNQWRAREPITLQQLIELSAGFADLSGAEFDVAKPLTRASAFETFATAHVTHWPPGLQHSYSNLPPAYSAAAVEALTGKPFARYLHTQVLAPLGMPAASLMPISGLPGGFAADGKTPIDYWHMVYPAFGALNATPREFASFLRQISSNALPASLAKALSLRGPVAPHEPSTTLAARAGLTLGYGSGLYGWLRRGVLFAGHGGDADGYRSRYAYRPDTSQGYFLVINTDNPALLRRLTGQIENTLIDRAGVRRPERYGDTPLLPASASRFSGRYYPASQRFGIQAWRRCGARSATLFFTGQTLAWETSQRRRVLHHAGANQWRFKGDPQPSVILVSHNGTRYLFGSLGNWVKTDHDSRCNVKSLQQPGTVE